MQKRCDVTIQAAANGYIVDPGGPAHSGQPRGGVMVFDTLDRLLDYLRDHYAKVDPMQNAMDRLTEKANRQSENEYGALASKARWGWTR